MRLQKFLALAGCTTSRRKAEEMITLGQVTVNGTVAHLGTCVDIENDSVLVNGVNVSKKSVILQKNPLVLLLNKPAGYVCSHFDRYNDKTIFDLVPKQFAKNKLMYCGRLDKTTEGMVILTDDGDIAQKLTHPSFGVKKHYEAVISRPLTEKVFKELSKGIFDRGEFLKFEKIRSIGNGRMRGLMFEIVLLQGKKNEIHRMFEHFGIFVNFLCRTRIGNLNLRGVSVGHCRKLSDDEIKMLLTDVTGGTKLVRQHGKN